MTIEHVVKETLGLKELSKDIYEIKEINSLNYEYNSNFYGTKNDLSPNRTNIHIYSMYLKIIMEIH